MTTRAAELAANVVPPGLKITNEEREIILEIAFLAVAADAKLSDEELYALSRIASRLACWLRRNRSKTVKPVSLQTAISPSIRQDRALRAPIALTTRG